MTKSRVLIVGLDGATWGVLERQIHAGTMPFLADLHAEGTHGVLQSTLPPLTPPAWATFQTGVNPGQHGVYDFVQHTCGGYDTSYVSSLSLRHPTVWELLSELGLRLVVVGVPLTYPPQPIRGAMVAGLLSPGPRSAFTYPPELKHEILRSLGTYRFLAPQEVFFQKGLARFLDGLLETERTHFGAAQLLMARQDWDVAMIQVQSLDNLQHALWPALDPHHEAYREDEALQVSRFFRTVDAWIQELHETAGPGIHTIILSDHGFGPLKRTVYLEEWLSRESYFELRRHSLRARSVRSVMRIVQRVDTKQLRRWLIGNQRRESLSAAIRRETIDWTRCQAYVRGSALYGAIRFNVRGREPAGTVLPADMPHVSDDLMRKLSELRDPGNGQPVVKRIHRTEDIYSGACLADAPDLLVEPTDGYVFTRGSHPKHKLLETAVYGRDVVGTHRREGIYLLHGPAAAAGEGPGADILDMAPTLFKLLGLEPPTSFEGSPLTLEP